MSNYFPFNLKGFVCIFKGPDIFGEFPFVLSVVESKGCLMVSVAFFEVGCKYYIRFGGCIGCRRALVHNVSL